MSYGCFKDIKGFEKLYQIDEYGNIKSFQKGKTKFLTHHIDSKGYLFIALSKNKKLFYFKIHRLVWLYHNPNDDILGYDIHHINNNKKDNNITNLRKILDREHNFLHKKTQTPSSGIGAAFDNRDKKWQSKIRFKGRNIFLGGFFKEEDALNAYKKATNELNEGLDLNLIYPRKRISKLSK